ncbi:hypothetical protein [Kosakonia sacchari]|uniref:Uncharacterized protein n=1 Tax=Kosakonia sacchari TaxID=1158459 RepID=A0ABZ0MN59_9ENTR|nr:hypothetical protein [Kosakonia sacchari]WOZ76503.1 hypothetical protein Q8Y70_18215 [Kosakonia sacchari]
MEIHRLVLFLPSKTFLWVMPRKKAAFSRVHHLERENRTNANFLLFYCYGDGKSG